MRLLLVEDDAMIGETVLHLLRTEHYAVDWVRDGALAGLAIFETIADWHGATLRLDQSAHLGGLRAELRMALARPPAPPTTALTPARGSQPC